MAVRFGDLCAAVQWELSKLLGVLSKFGDAERFLQAVDIYETKNTLKIKKTRLEHSHVIVLPAIITLPQFLCCFDLLRFITDGS